jgi:hypothetical protein
MGVDTIKIGLNKQPTVAQTNNKNFKVVELNHFKIKDSQLKKNVKMSENE